MQQAALDRVKLVFTLLDAGGTGGLEVSVRAAGVKDHYGPEKAGLPGDHPVPARS
ncbi:hypothetical protein [Microtetraspora niveoalba]|uniref:hypothetical protein n=1 Tax=Microtetraspora niveoalba TaxID=46175 RepID=UPI000B153190|nr:hypothetical protein [Microtetraspora niveoalba]